MGFFTAKQHILPVHVMIGTDDGVGGIDWDITTHDYVQLYIGVLEDRGHREVNGIVYKLYYLPPPSHSHTVGP